MSLRKKNYWKLTGASILLIITLFLLSGAYGLTAAEKPTIASVNLDKIIKVHPAFAEANQKYQALVMELQEDLKNKLESSSEEEAMALQSQAQNSLQQKAMELQNEAIEQIKLDIQSIADEKGYDYIVVENMLFAGGPVEDATEKFLEALNQNQ